MTRRTALALLALLLASGDAAADLAQAEAAWANGEREEAARLVRDYVGDHPEGARTARVAALLARTAASPSEAVGRWDEVIALEPEGALAAEAHWNRGLHAYSAGLYVAATREFALLAESFAGTFDAGRAALWKGKAELGADSAGAAAESFERARRGASDPADVRSAELGLAHAAFALGNVKDALRRYERFESEHPQDGRASSAARRAVECLRLLGRTDEASVQAVRIERQYPNSFEATLAREEIRQIEPAPAPVRETARPEPADTGPFVVQVAAMEDLANAVVLRREIRRLGIEGVRVELADGPRGPVHRVLLGPYETEEEARAVADSIATLGDLDPRVHEASE